MTATDWLLLGLVVFIVVCIAMTYMINSELRSDEEPTYRTADSQTIAKQIATLRRNTPN